MDDEFVAGYIQQLLAHEEKVNPTPLIKNGPNLGEILARPTLRSDFTLFAFQVTRAMSEIADSPTEVPADVPAAVPADVPAAVPADIPAEVPADTPAEVSATLSEQTTRSSKRRANRQAAAELPEAAAAEEPTSE